MQYVTVTEDCAVFPEPWEYSREMRQVLEAAGPNLSIREGMATELIMGANDDVAGVRTFFGMEFHAPAVVLTTGTFMAGPGPGARGPGAAHFRPTPREHHCTCAHSPHPPPCPGHSFPLQLNLTVCS